MLLKSEYKDNLFFVCLKFLCLYFGVCTKKYDVFCRTTAVFCFRFSENLVYQQATGMKKPQQPSTKLLETLPPELIGDSRTLGRFPSFHFLHTFASPFCPQLLLCACHGNISAWHLPVSGEMLPSTGENFNLWDTVLYVCSCFVFNRCALLPVFSAWLTGYDHPMIDTINQRIEDLTGLEMDTAEELQVKS